jgi:hypothetical protein
LTDSSHDRAHTELDLETVVAQRRSVNKCAPRRLAQCIDIVDADAL